MQNWLNVEKKWKRFSFDELKWDYIWLSFGIELNRRETREKSQRRKFHWINFDNTKWSAILLILFWFWEETNKGALYMSFSHFAF